MSDDDPKIRFIRPSKDKQEERITFRTKTNDAPRMPPPQAASRPAPNIHGISNGR